MNENANHVTVGVTSNTQQAADQTCAGTNETAYCITIGSREIYGVTHQQLQELHQTVERFVEREKAPFECKMEDYGEHPISISKSVDLCAGDDHFSIDYSLSASDLELCCLSAAQMQRIADTISGFLKEYGENGDRNVRWDIAAHPEERITFKVEANSKPPVCVAAPWVSKCINRKENGETGISYFIDINETHSPNLSLGEFITVYRKLDHFLKKPAGANKINH